MTIRRQYYCDDDSYEEQHDYLYDYDSYEEQHDYLYDDEPEELEYPRVNWHSDWPYPDEDELPVSIIEFDPVDDEEEEIEEDGDEIENDLWKEVESYRVDGPDGEWNFELTVIKLIEDGKPPSFAHRVLWWHEDLPERLLQLDISYRFGRIYGAIRQEFGGQVPAIITSSMRQDPARGVARYLWMASGEIPTRVMELLSGVESVPDFTDRPVTPFWLGVYHECMGVRIGRANSDDEELMDIYTGLKPVKLWRYVMENSPPFLLGRILAVIEKHVGSVPDEIADAIKLDLIDGLTQFIRYSYGTLCGNAHAELELLFHMLGMPPDELARGDELLFWSGYYYERSLDGP